jgi:PEP-CTERM motif
MKNLLPVLFLAMISVNSATATPITFLNSTGSSAAFDLAAAAAGISLTVDGFEDLGSGLIDYGSFLARSDYTITTAGGSPSLRSTDNINSIISGARSMILFNNTDPMTFSIGNAVNAFAITFKDIDMSFGGDFTVSINGGPTQTLLTSGAGNDLNVFFGVIDLTTPFSTTTFNRTVGDGYSFDLVNFGSQAASTVPEPTSMAIFSLGALGLSFGYRRR